MVTLLLLLLQVRQCLRLGNARMATKVKHDFKMSDRTFAWLRVQTLAEAKDWEVRCGENLDAPFFYNIFVVYVYSSPSHNMPVFLLTCAASCTPTCTGSQCWWSHVCIHVRGRTGS